MKFKFKIQGYQTDAVANTTAIFTGQPNRESSKYRRDLGKRGSGVIRFEGDDDGYRNADVELSSKQLLENLHSVQTAAGVPLSKSLSKIDGLGAVNLDVEMETGTGKTYVYIKTMFELNKLYGWSKFIIVVPSIAIGRVWRSPSVCLRSISWNITERKPVGLSTIARTSISLTSSLRMPG